MIVGYDKNNNELKIGDVCSFDVRCPFEKKIVKMEGMIGYSNDCFAYEFDIDENKYSHYISLLMSQAEFETIEKIKKL